MPVHTLHIFGHLAAFLAATLVAPAALGQCPARWVPTGGVANADGSGSVRAIAIIPNGPHAGDAIVGGSFAIAGGIPASGMARYTPSTGAWSAIGSAVHVIGSVYALAVLPDGDIIAGGKFTTDDAVPANNIARWNPTTDTWTILGSGTSNGVTSGSSPGVRALAALPGGDVVILGTFPSGSSLPPWLDPTTGGVGRWNASTNTISTIVSGFGIPSCGIDCPTLLVHPPNALAALHDGDAVVGGSFDTVGTVAANSIARWNPPTATWSPMGVGLGHGVNTAIALPNGDVVAGGTFVALGDGTPARHVARWSATTNTWAPMGDVTALAITALASLSSAPDDVIAAGYPASPQSGTTQILRWSASGGTWSSLGSLGNGSPAVFAAAALPGGDILVGGSFTTADGNPAIHFARWTTRPQCPADYNCSGAAEIHDIFDFLNAWFALDPRTDFNGINGMNAQDIFDFLAAWFLGC